MEENIKIKLNIGDRVYPLKVQRSQEFYFREAAKIIEKTIKNLEQNYSVRDKQDLLAMCCIQFACLLYTSPSPRDMPRSRMPSSA